MAVLAAAVTLPVPFVPQRKDTCGAAALAMVMRYWGADVSHDWGWWKRQALHHLGRRFGAS